MEAYCMKCKEKREIKDPQAVFNKASSPATRGICGECGTTLYRMGKTPEHEGLIPPPKKDNRKGRLVIVESPAKARTVGRFLGKGYTVKASVGHVRDLLRSQLSVDVENNFEPKYRVPNEKKDVVKELKSLAKKAAQIYLATDPDREGEAIAWHLKEAIEIEDKLSKRVVFHEITESAVAEAFAHPREINMDLVNAQQARRILDRLVGYGISPILWEKVRSRLSAGRVQSVALKLIVERENEIDAFIPEEYWSIEGEFLPEIEQNKEHAYLAKLKKVDDVAPEFSRVDQVQPLLEDMQSSQYSIQKLKRSERRRKPYAPFITSTLQQEASRKLGYTAKRTMGIAQSLYEGIEAGEGGQTGLITYMRTDSVNISDQAKIESRNYIKERFGNNFLPASSPVYKTRAKGAQEAHEAIRPTSAYRDPEKIKPFLQPAQFKLYQLIWQRFIASQMKSAVYDTLSIDIKGLGSDHEYLFHAAGSTLKFQGFLIVYKGSKFEDPNNKNDKQNVKIPDSVEEGQEQILLKLIPEQHFTQPPPRYSEASLVQAMEEHGIGRPSTYAPILSTIQNRGYVSLQEKKLFPSETGIHVNELIINYFSEIVDVGFTARMENDLDKIADGSMIWNELVADFYDPFSKSLQHAQAEMPVSKKEPESIGRQCPDCGKDLVIRFGRYGKFISCSGFPECKYTEPWLNKIGVTCPEDGGEVVERKTRKGRTFYGCSNYPTCDFTSWKKPLKTLCSKCNGTLVVANKREAQCLKCESSYLLEELSADE
ncbi:type I DNA topoisomerase [Chloroflexota bacterium]